MVKRKFLLFCFIPLFLVLTACGEIVIEMNQDGSGTAEMEIPNNGVIPIEMVESQLENELNDTEGISNISITESDSEIEVSFQFEDVSNIDPFSYQIPVSDYVITNDTRLETLMWEGEPVEFDENSSAVFIQLPGEVNDLRQAKVVLPGDIVAHTDNVEVTEADTIDITSTGNVYVAYEPQTSMSGFIWGGIIIVIGVAVFYFIRKNKTEQPATEKEGELHA